jgi:signal transduction histidine kinase
MRGRKLQVGAILEAVDASPHADLELIAEQQAALRRLATLVARGAAASELYSAVAEEAALVLDISAVILARYEPDDSATVLAQLNEPTFPVGSNWRIDGPSVTAAVRDTGRPARVDDYSRLPSSIAASVRDSSIRSTVGVPIRVDGEVWGVLTVAADEVSSLSSDMEDRLADFAELLATGISNAAALDRLQRILEQQAALRRVATLVARESSPPEIFRAVTDEALGVLDTEAVGLLRVETDGSVSLVAQSDAPWDPPPLETRLALDGDNVIVEVVRTGKAARVDDWTGATGSVAELATGLGVRSCVATPIAVEGRLWGVMVSATSRSEPLASDTQARTEQFADLVATAIANAEGQSELAASRRRMVAAADDARQRIERDLHDGIQQQLISLGMELGALEATLSSDDAVGAQVAAVSSGLRRAIDDLREISRGIHPAILAHGGLTASLKTLARRSPVPVRLTAAVDDGRLTERVEVAAYYVVSEALTNVARHSGATVVDITVTGRDTSLEVSIRDDGAGGADARNGTGLIGLKDRVEAIGGRMSVESPRGRGTSLAVMLPLDVEGALGIDV